jgi:hypothetical protein
MMDSICFVEKGTHPQCRGTLKEFRRSLALSSHKKFLQSGDGNNVEKQVAVDARPGFRTILDNREA